MKPKSTFLMLVFFWASLIGFVATGFALNPAPGTDPPDAHSPWLGKQAAQTFRFGTPEQDHGKTVHNIVLNQRDAGNLNASGNTLTIAAGDLLSVRVENSEAGQAYRIRRTYPADGSFLDMVSQGGALQFPDFSIPANGTHIMTVSANGTGDYQHSFVINVTDGKNAPVNAIFTNAGNFTEGGGESISVVPELINNVSTICNGGSVVVSIHNTNIGEFYRVRQTFPSQSTWIEVESIEGGTIQFAPLTIVPPSSGNAIVNVWNRDYPDNFTTSFIVAIVSQPTAPVLTKVPDVASVCKGTSVKATLSTAGSGGVTACSDSYEYSTDGGTSWSEYTLNTPISTTGLSSVDIRAIRSDNTGAGCSATNTYSWTMLALPIPSINGSASVNTCATETYTTESGMTGYTWTITGGSGSSTTETIDVTWGTAGTGTVAVNYTDGNGCTATSATSQYITISNATVLTAATLKSTLNQATWQTLAGNLGNGYNMYLYPCLDYSYLDIESATFAQDILDETLHPFYLDQTALPANWWSYWAAKGVTASATTGWEAVMWKIINGNKPIFYMYRDGSSYQLIDGLLYQIGQGMQLLRISGDYPLGDYTYNGHLYLSTGCYSETSIGMTFHKGVANLTQQKVYSNIQNTINAAAANDIIEICAGTYNERVVINKTLTLQGSDESTCILDGTGLGNGRGILINNGITGVTIQNLTVQNFSGASGNTDGGIYAIGGNNNLTIQHVTLKDNRGPSTSGSGFYANGPIDNVLIDHVTSTGHYPGARGIVIWNGLKSNITITNCEVYNNNCCGIELQDGTASGVLMQNNNIYNNGDNGIGVVGLQGPGENLIKENTLSNNGRFGIEVKNPNGSGLTTGAGRIVVENNTVSRTNPIGSELRDIMGIAAFRRGVLAGNVDVPTGVVIQNNTVSGYVQPSNSDGFGIVVEGTNHSVLNNNVSGCDVGIQQQAGHLPYPADGDQSNLADQYFGRGNSPVMCGISLNGNTYSSNGTNERTVGTYTTDGYVRNTQTGKTFCSIQAAIDDAATLAGHTIEVGAGIYNENTTISKSITVAGTGPDQTILTLTGTASANGTGVSITASGAKLQNLKVTNYNNGIAVSNTLVEILNVESVLNANTGLELSAGTGNFTIKNSKLNQNKMGFRKGTVPDISGFTMENCEVKDNTAQGCFIAAENGTNVFSNILIKNSDFSGNLQKGMYFEVLSEATLEGIIMSDAGVDPTYGFNNGIDINLKYGTYSNIVLKDSEITGCGVTGIATAFDNPAAVAIKARDDGSYSGNPAILTQVIIQNNIISGPQNGLRFGEFGKVNSGPSGVTLSNNDFSATFAYKALINNTNSDINAECNWWGTANGSSIASKISNGGSGATDYESWITTAGDGTGTGFQPTGSCNGTTPVVTVSADHQICGENSGSIIIQTMTGGVPPYTVYYGSNSLAQGSCDPLPYTINNITPGSYQVYITDANGTASPEVTVTIEYLPVHNTSANTYHASIQSAIDAATTVNGHVIEVCAGTYAENITINGKNGLSLRGPNAGLGDANGTRSGEASIVAATNASLIIIESNVTSYTIDGFRLAGADYNDGGTIGRIIWAKGQKTVSNILNNVIELTSNASGTKRYIWLGFSNSVSSGSDFISGSISHNQFKAFGTGSGFNGICMQQWSKNFNIYANKFEGLTGQRNILIWHPTPTVVISNNEFSRLDAAGDLISVQGPAPTVTAGGIEIQNNIFDSPGKGVLIGSGVNYNTTISNNDFENVTGLSIEIQTGSTGIVAGTCNWWGTADGDLIAAKSSGTVQYSPWLTEENDGPAVGFQPTGSCNGTPVVIESAEVDPITCGETTGLITVSWSGGVDNYTIDWGGTPATGITASPYNITGLAAGEYTITVTDQYGTSDTYGPVNIQYLPVHNTSANTYHASIQSAIDAATTFNGHVIEVCAGTYAEVITVSKPLELRGTYWNESPNKGKRNSANEVVIIPPTSNPTVTNLITITASNVSILGFTIDGDNTNLTDSGEGLNGSFDAARGIWVSTNGLTGIKVEKNIVRNMLYSGVRFQQATNFFATTSGATFSYNNLINDNLIEDGSGIGVDLRQSMYAKITNNAIKNVRYGIYFHSFRINDLGNEADRIISGNTIETRQFGIWPNLFSARPYQVTDNTITAVADASRPTWYGIMKATVSTAQNFTSQLNLPKVSTPEKWVYTNNIIDAEDAHENTTTYGVWLWHVDNNRDDLGNNHFNTFTGGNISNVDVGFLLHNVDNNPATNFSGGPPASVTNTGAHANIYNVQISLNADGTGILMKDDASWPTGNLAPLTAKRDVKLVLGSDVVINGGAEGIVLNYPVSSTPGYTSYVAIEGSALGNLALNTQTGQYIELINYSENLDATAVLFNGKTGTTADLSENLAIEDKVFHTMDASTSGLVTWVPSNVYVTTNTLGIQRGVDAASTGYIVNVAQGAFTENLNINKAVALKGANSDATACGSRGPESKIAPASGLPVSVTADDVTINGFEITAPGYQNAIVCSNRSNLTISHNNIHDIGTSITNTNVHSIIYVVANAASTSNVNILDNCFNNISSSLLTGYSASAIGVLQSTSTGVLTGLNIERNTINNVNVNTSNWPTGKLAYGIIINVGSANYQTTNGKVKNAIISANEISGLSGFISTGIALEGNTENAIVQNNYVANISGNKTANREGGGYDLQGLKFETNRFIGTCTVQNNSFATDTYNHGNPNGVGYAVANYVPSTVGTAALGCNWYGTAVYNEIADNDDLTGKILNKEGCETTFVPYLVSGADDEPGTIGFQSIPETCKGEPVVIASAVPTHIHCGETNGSILVTFSGGTAPYNITWTGGSANGISSPYTIASLAAGSYTITVTDTYGSSDVITAEVLYLPVTNTTASTYHPTIQAAIDAATAGDFINVCAGTYVESIVIDKGIVLRGPNYGKDPNVDDRVPEAVVEFTDWYGVYFDVANVTIDGFTFNGKGICDYGIYTYVSGAGGHLFTNNIVKNVNTMGYIGWVQTGIPSSQNIVTKNLFEDMPNARAVVTLWNYYANITNNVIQNTSVGLYAENANQPESSGLVEWKNNTISASRSGIWYNLAYGTATPLTIKDNTIAYEENTASTRWDGIWLTSLGGSINPTISGNIINGADPSTKLVSGYNLWHNTTTANDGITIQGGSVTNVDYGVWINNWDGYPTSTGSNAGRTKAKIDGLTITDADLAGLYLKDNPLNTSGASAFVYAKLTNSTISGSGTGVLIQGDDASADLVNNLATITGNQVGILVKDGADLASVIGNTITNNTHGGIVVESTAGTIGVINNNTISGNGYSVDDAHGLGLKNELTTTVDAQNNWWGDASGPYITTYNTCGLGNAVVGNVDFMPWWTTSTGTPSSDLLVYNVTQGTYYCKIQDAIDDAGTGGETIEVGTATFSEHIQINKTGLILKTATSATPIIDGSGTGTVVTISANNVTLEGFVIQNSGLNPVDAGVIIGAHTGCTIQNNTVTACASGIGIQGGSGNSVTSNAVSGNAYYGVVIIAGTGNTINQNNISGNGLDAIALDNASAGGGPVTIGSTGNFIVENTISSNRDGIFLGENCTGNQISGGNNITGTTTGSVGINLWRSGSQTITENTIQAFITGIRLLGSSSNTITGNTLTSNTNGFKIDPSWQVGVWHQSLNNNISLNSIEGNITFGMMVGDLIHQTTPVDATANWWGSNTGPTYTGNPCGTGDAISDNVLYDPWRNEALNTDIYQLQAFTVTGNSSICVGGTANITLSGSQLGTGFNYLYDLYKDNLLVAGETKTGDGNPLVWTVSTGSNSTYTVKAKNDLNLCTLDMQGSATVFIGPITTLPTLTACANSLVEVPVTVTDFNDVGSISLRLKYDKTVMSYNSYSTVTGIDFEVFSDETGTEGILTIGAMPASQINLANGATLLTLKFDFTSGTGNLQFDDSYNTYCEYGSGPPSFVAFCDEPGIHYYINGSVSCETVPPTFTRPADITIYRDENCSYDASTTATGDVTDKADNCGVGQATYIDAVDANNPCSVIITRTWSLVDNCGNAAADQIQTITVKDNTEPQATAPSTVNLTCATGLPAAATTITEYLALNGSAASDNCTPQDQLSVTSVTATLTGSNCSGSITRTYTITDLCGNFTQVDQTFNIADNIVPAMTGPADREIEGCSELTALPEPKQISLAASGAAGVYYPDRYAPHAFEVANFNGGERLKHQIDASACQECRPGGYKTSFYNTQGRKYNTPGALSLAIDLYVPSEWATTGRRMAGLWGTAFNAGNELSFYPIIEFSSENAIPRFKGWNGNGWVDMGLPSSFTYDNWYTLSIQLVGSNVVYTVGDLTVAIPANNSVSIENMILQGHNTTTPGVTYDIYWDNFRTQGVNLAYSETPVTISASQYSAEGGSVTDNCTNLNITYVDTKSGTCPTVVTRTFTATDACENNSSISQTITIDDNTPPTFTRPNDITIYRDANCNYDASTSATGDVTDAADNCGVGQATYADDVDDSNPCEVIITRTWSLVDNCGNAAADQVQTITVEDNTPPTFTRPNDITIYRDANCNYDASTSATGDVTDAADNCGVGQATYADDVDDSNPCEVIITRTWSLVDNCGNAAADQEQIIYILDNTAPTITPPADVTTVTNDGCTATGVDLGTPVVDDNCTATGDLTVTNDAPTAFPYGQTTVVTWEVTDGCGNTATATQNVTVGGHTLSGTFKYYGLNPNGTPKTSFDNLSGINVELWQNNAKVYPASGTITTDASGAYTFTGICSGAYQVVASTTKSTTGAINSTDAAQVNYWGVIPYEIQLVRFYTGDGVMDNYLDGSDASRILKNFTTSGTWGWVNRGPWTFWLTGEIIDDNPLIPPTQIVLPSITITNSSLTKDFYGMVTGDFNGSFVPSAKSYGHSLTLTHPRMRTVEKGQEILLPVTTSESLEAGAVSLIMEYPSDRLEITGAFFGTDPSSEVEWAVNESGELRLGWFALQPAMLDAGDVLLTLRVRVTGDIALDETLVFSLTQEATNEIADGRFLSNGPTELHMDALTGKSTGTHENPEQHTLNLTCFPNPFRGTTTLAYSLPADGKVTLDITSMLGAQVTTLVDEAQTAGDHTLTLDASTLKPGVYTATLRLDSDGAQLVRTIRIVRSK